MPDSFTSALARLDPASRALLDLSLRRGMRTEEIAEVLGADPDSVAASRDEALRRVARDTGVGEDDLDTVRAQLAELPAEEWLGGGAPATAEAEPRAEEPDRAAEMPAGTGPAARDRDPAPQRAVPPRDGARRRRSVWPVVAGLLLIGAVVLAVALAAGGDDGGGGGPAADQDTQETTAQETTEEETPEEEETTEQGAPTPESHEGGARFRPVGAGNAEGRARLTDGAESIQVDVRGLPSPPNGGHFEVWLYSSLVEAQSLGRSRDPVVSVEAELPRDWRDYRFVDVSIEPPDGNAAHSGESVARVPVGALAGQ